MAFPQTRMRRLRSSASLRGLVRETELRAGQLVLPLFVTDGDPTHPGGDGSPPTREPIATLAHSSVRRKRVTAMVIANAISPASTSVSPQPAGEPLSGYCRGRTAHNALKSK